MALLFFDGFDHYGTGGDPVILGKWGTTSGTGGSIQTTVVRTGTHIFRVASTSGGLYTKIFTSSGGAVIGFAIHITGIPTSNLDIIQILEASIIHVAIGITTTGLLTIKRGSTVLQTGTHALIPNNWYYIDLKTTIHDTTGSYELRIDGVTELSATNVDTQNAGTGIWNRVFIGATPAPGTNLYFDDFYVCDTSGSAPRNTFLGSIKVETLMPQTDAVAAGSNAGLTPSTGTDHGALVDELGPNITDYNSSPTVGLKDTYNYPSMTLTGTIYGIQTNLYVSKSDATARTVCPVVRMAGVDTDGTAISPTTTFTYSSQVWEQNPNAGSPIEWTTGDIVSIQAGMKVVS